jgi:hypothetical protein
LREDLNLKFFPHILHSWIANLTWIWTCRWIFFLVGKTFPQTSHSNDPWAEVLLVVGCANLKEKKTLRTLPKFRDEKNRIEKRFCWCHLRFDKNVDEYQDWRWMRDDVRSPKQWFLKSG